MRTKYYWILKHLQVRALYYYGMYSNASAKNKAPAIKGTSFKKGEKRVIKFKKLAKHAIYEELYHHTPAPKVISAIFKKHNNTSIKKWVSINKGMTLKDGAQFPTSTVIDNRVFTHQQLEYSFTYSGYTKAVKDPQNNKIVTYKPSQIEIQDIFASDFYIQIAKWIVKSIAKSPKSDISGACIDIVNSGYTDIVFEDIMQSIGLELLELKNNNELYIHYNNDNTFNIVFCEYINRDGKKGTSYLKLYKAVRKCLGLYKNSHGDIYAGLNVYDCLVVNSNGAYTINSSTYDSKKGEKTKYTNTPAPKEYTKKGEKSGLKVFNNNDGHQLTPIINTSYSIDSAKNTSYLYNIGIQSHDSIENIVNRNDIQLLFKYIKTHTSAKKFTLLCNVFNGLWDGLKSDQICKKYGYSIDVVKKARTDLKKLYRDSTISIDVILGNKPIQYGCKAGLNYHCYGKLTNYTKADIPALKQLPIISNEDRQKLRAQAGIIDNYDWNKHYYNSAHWCNIGYYPNKPAPAPAPAPTIKYKRYSDDMFIEYIRNKDSIDVFYTSYVDIDGTKQKNRVYQHSIKIH